MPTVDFRDMQLLAQDITMMFDRILVEKITREKTEGGILLPQDQQSKTNEGRVVAVGPGRWYDGEYIPVQPKVGDIVRFSASTKFPYKNAEFLVVDERNVIAILPS